MGSACVGRPVSWLQMQETLQRMDSGAPPHPRRRVLFVGYGNSCRSQMAEAFARHYGMGFLDAVSAGLEPDERVTQQARALMVERRIAVPELARPKPLSVFDLSSFDLTIFLTEFDIPIEADAMMKIHTPDTRHMNDRTLRQVRDQIETRVVEIVNQLRPKPHYWPILLAYRDVPSRPVPAEYRTS
jgi:arsenate reductase (thioredoxin)